MLSHAGFFKSEAAANKIIQKFSVTATPVPIFEIVHKMQIGLVEYNLGEGTSGVLVIDKGVGTIGFNPKDSLVRRRFTVAHELGHFVLHKKVNHLFVDNYFLMKFRKNNSYTESEARQEQEANSFAAALLMPETFIEKLLTLPEFKNTGESEIITALASKFKVSVPAMSFRLTNLNIF